MKSDTLEPQYLVRTLSDRGRHTLGQTSVAFFAAISVNSNFSYSFIGVYQKDELPAVLFLAPSLFDKIGRNALAPKVSRCRPQECLYF